MIKKLLPILILLVCSTALAGQGMYPVPMVYQGSTPAATYTVEENFEGTGYDGSETWGEISYCNEDYTTTALRGSQSLSSGNTGGTGGGSCYVQHDDGDTELWGHFLYYNDGTLANNHYVFRMVDGANANLLKIYQNSNGTIAMLCGGSFESYTTDTISVDTQYHMWWHWKAGTGDAECEIKFTADATRTRGTFTGNAALSVTDGTSVGDGDGAAATYYEGDSLASHFIIVDQVLYDDVDLSSVDE